MGVAYLRKVEREDGQPQRVRKRPWYEERINVLPEYTTVLPDADLIKVYTKPWFRTLRRELSRKALRKIEELSGKELPERMGELPDLLDEEINGIERDKWHLV